MGFIPSRPNTTFFPFRKLFIKKLFFVLDNPLFLYFCACNKSLDLWRFWIASFLAMTRSGSGSKAL